MKSLKRLAVVGAAIISIFGATGTTFAAAPFKRVRAGLVHVSSGVIFPTRVGPFRFEGTKLYGSAGRDVGAEYDVAPVIRGDVYVYPLGTYGKDFNAEMRVQQKAINQTYKGVKQVSQSRVQLNQGGRTISGARVQYELTRALFRSNARRRCGSQFYIFRDGPWLVAYRFSYPIEQTATANKQIADFLRLWQWRAQGRLTRVEIPTNGRGS
jgi:hypothetical protein